MAFRIGVTVNDTINYLLHDHAQIKGRIQEVYYTRSTIPCSRPLFTLYSSCTVSIRCIICLSGPSLHTIFTVSVPSFSHMYHLSFSPFYSHAVHWSFQGRLRGKQRQAANLRQSLSRLWLMKTCGAGTYVMRVQYVRSLCKCCCVHSRL